MRRNQLKENYNENVIPSESMKTDTDFVLSGDDGVDMIVYDEFEDGDFMRGLLYGLPSSIILWALIYLSLKVLC
jgi:hypothetical protein